MSPNTFRMGDYRCLKAIRGLVQAVTGSETSSDELDCLNRLIEPGRELYTAIKHGRLWTTIRAAWPPEKEEYYRSHVGELVNIEV